MHNTITFTREKYLALQKAYLEAVLNGEETLMFEGREFVNLYAKTVLEYLRIALKIK